MTQPNDYGYAPAHGGAAPPPGAAPAPGGAAPTHGYAQAPGAAPAPANGYAPAPGAAGAPAPQQEEDLSNVSLKLKKGAPGRADINFDFWSTVPEEQTFNVPNDPSEVTMLPHGTWRAQVLFCKLQRKKQEWGGGLSLRIKLGFMADPNGQGHQFPYQVWSSISVDNDTTLSEFATAACPWKKIDEDEFKAQDAMGRYVMISVGYGTGNWAQGGKSPRVVIQSYGKAQEQPGTAAAGPPPAAPPAQPQHQPANAGYGKTYGGAVPPHQQTAAPGPTPGAGYGAPAPSPGAGYGAPAQAPGYGGSAPAPGNPPF
jgi:hypothetical protein